MKDALGHLKGRDRRLVHIRQKIDVKKIIPSLESVQDLSRATVRSLTQGRDRVLEIVRRVGDRKAVHSVQGK